MKLNTQVDSIIVFGEDWGRHPSSTQHLVTHLSKHYRVIWVNSIGLRQPTLTPRDLKRIVQKLGDKFGNLLASKLPGLANKQGSQLIPSKPNNAPAKQPETEDHKPDFPIIAPITIPAPQSKTARVIAKWMLKRQLDKVIQQESIKNPLLWLSLPTAVDMIGCFNEQATLYYCGDDFGALAGVDHDTVIKREQELTDKADIIFTVSNKLMERFPKEKSHLLPHGVDFDLFSQPTSIDERLLQPNQTSVDHTNHPIAGFYGSLSEWLNTEMIIEVAKRLPNWRFVFVGKPDIDITQLTDLPNIEHYPPVAHNQLPSFSQHWTVSMLPFRDSEQIRACNPLKLREYLATGRPVVSTWYPALEPYKEVIAVENDVDGFVAALENARNGSAFSDETLQNKVMDETWEARANSINKLL